MNTGVADGAFLQGSFSQESHVDLWQDCARPLPGACAKTAEPPDCCENPQTGFVAKPDKGLGPDRAKLAHASSVCPSSVATEKVVQALVFRRITGCLPKTVRDVLMLS
ncbi:hypothetical protein SRHO_G00215260 [Serrasalmus rhombeus]